MTRGRPLRNGVRYVTGLPSDPALGGLLAPPTLGWTLWTNHTGASLQGSVHSVHPCKEGCGGWVNDWWTSGRRLRRRRERVQFSRMRLRMVQGERKRLEASRRPEYSDGFALLFLNVFVTSAWTPGFGPILGSFPAPFGRWVSGVSSPRSPEVAQLLPKLWRFSVFSGSETSEPLTLDIGLGSASAILTYGVCHGDPVRPSRTARGPGRPRHGPRLSVGGLRNCET